METQNASGPVRSTEVLRPEDFRSQVAREIWHLGAQNGWITVSRKAALPVEVAFIASQGYLDGWPVDLGHDSAVVAILEEDPVSFLDGLLSLGDACERIQGPQGMAFLKRALGAREVDRLKRAWKADRSIFKSALEMLWAGLMPFLNAFQICRDISDAPPLPKRALPAAASATIQYLVEQFADEVAATTSTGVDNSERNEHVSIVRAPSSVISEMLAQLNSPLLRKVQGARDVLGVSSDAVSQAANSAVELIDHALRVLDDKTVMTWTSATYPGDNENLTYADESGALRPTKRAQALHLLLGGGSVDDEVFVAAMCMVADVLTKARRGLEKLKHGDEGNAEELVVETLLGQVEASLIVLLGVVRLSQESHRDVVYSAIAKA